MDSFQGSLPPKFISFRLENQIPAEDTTTIPEILHLSLRTLPSLIHRLWLIFLILPGVLTSKKALRR